MMSVDHRGRSLAILSILALVAGSFGFITNSPLVSAASLPAGAPYTWGSGVGGALGNGGTTNSLVPVAVDTSGVLSGESVVQVAGINDTYCALSASGAVFCWGSGEDGELGNGSTTSSTVPVAVDTSGALAGKVVTQISTLSDSSCALTSDGGVYCWGSNAFGQLGNGSAASSTVPVAVDTSGVLAGRTVTSLSTSGFASTCAVLDDGTIACWGAGVWGQMGNGSLNDANRSPVLVDMTGVLAGKTAISVTAGFFHVCALMSDATASCWGMNTDGQLGEGTTISRIVPILVDTSGALAGQDIASLSGGGYSTCSLTTAGIAYCWGDNTYSQLGDGSSTNSAVPVALDATGILAGEPISTISVSTESGCATTVSGRAACWGLAANGQLGNGAIGPEPSPVWVDTSGVLSGRHVEQVSTSYYSTASWARVSTGCATPSPPLLLAGAYQVGTAAHIEWLRDDSTRWDDTYVMVADIDMNACAWSTTIGDDTTSFTGEFDGNGHTVSGIDIDVASSSTVSVGFFGRLGAGHHVHDVRVEGDVTGTSQAAPADVNVGGLAGYATGGVIERATFSGNVTATQSTPHTTRVVAGGLVGLLYDDTITESAALATFVTAEMGDPYAGGLVGLAQGGLASGTQTWIHDSFAEGVFVTAQDQFSSGGSIAGGLIGGMAGGSGDAEVRDSYAQGFATVRDARAVGIRGSAGGLVGYANQGSISNSYASVSVASVNPEGVDNIGGVAGYLNSDPSISTSVWNTDVTQTVNAVGFDGGASVSVTAATETSMEQASTFTGEGWAIVGAYEPPGANTWGICENQSYPYLLWQAQTLATPGNPCSGLPTISGTAAVGQTLVASFTTPLSDRAFQWYRVDAQGNAVGLVDYDETFVVSAADVGNRLKVQGRGFENGIVTNAFSAMTAVVPDPSPPAPTPASPPRNLLTVPGDASVALSWEAPAASGSFPVSQYQVQGTPSGTCLVPANSLECDVAGLVNGEAYEFRVRALTGAGWGAWSEVVSVTPGVAASIVITGARDGRRVVVEGVTAGLVGAEVTPWFRFPGPSSYAAGTGVRTVSADGTFTWQRRTAKKIYVYFRADDGVRSNRVIIPAR